MDDLFDGWMVLDQAMAGFLEDDSSLELPITRNKQSKPDPPNGQHLPHSSHSTPPSTLEVIRYDQRLATSGNNTASNTGVRQRRGHTKSRLGCITCKRRRVKCQQTRPSCANCIKRGSTCIYPNAFIHEHRDHATFEVPSPRRCIKLSETPTVYTPDDMQLFHHYLVVAYPCIPHDLEDVWVREVPAQSHHCSYLMEAMLALAGSHLDLQVEKPKPELALRHRQKAIVGLEEAFTRWPPSASEAHLMLAASYLLSFQSCYLKDGFMEYVISLRGCSLLSQLVLSRGLCGAFAIQTDVRSADMENAFRDFPELDQELVYEALQSLRGFAHLVAASTAHPIERALVAKLTETLRHLLHGDAAIRNQPVVTPALTVSTTISETSSPCTTPESSRAVMNPLFPSDVTQAFDAIDWNTITTPSSPTADPIQSFNALMSTLTILATWSHGALLHVFDPTNQLGNIVMAHLCAVRFIVSPLSAPQSAMRTPAKAMVDWAAKIIAAVDEADDQSWSTYVAWPRKILECMQENVAKKKGFTLGDIRKVLLQHPEAFKQGET